MRHTLRPGTHRELLEMGMSWHGPRSDLSAQRRRLPEIRSRCAKATYAKTSYFKG